MKNKNVKTRFVVVGFFIPIKMSSMGFRSVDINKLNKDVIFYGTEYLLIVNNYFTFSIKI